MKNKAKTSRINHKEAQQIQSNNYLFQIRNTCPGSCFQDQIRAGNLEPPVLVHGECSDSDIHYWGVEEVKTSSQIGA